MPDAEQKPGVAASPVDDLDLILAAGEEAGRIAMRHFRSDPDVWYKNEGSSPVSAADIAVDTFLKEALRPARPDYGWLSEETADAAHRLTHETVFVVDPIDGTRAFIEGRDTWCVSIAVVSGGMPVAGVLVAPALGEIFVSGAKGPSLKNGGILGAPSGPSGGGPLRFSGPAELIRGIAERIGCEVERTPHVPSLAYRLAMVADGRLDATLVRAKAHDWDVAAADLILRNTGGWLTTLEGEAIAYDRENVHHGILVAGGAGLDVDLARVVRDLQATR